MELVGEQREQLGVAAISFDEAGHVSRERFGFLTGTLFNHRAFGAQLRDLEGPLVQRDERLRLRTQHVDIEWLRQEIDGAEVVRALDAVRVVVVRGQEDDRDVLRLAARAHEASGLVAVHVRHPDVHQDEREVFTQKMRERFAAGARVDEIAAQRRQRGLEREEIRVVVVDEQDVWRLDAIASHDARLEQLLPRHHADLEHAGFRLSSQGTTMTPAKHRSLLMCAPVRGANSPV